MTDQRGRACPSDRGGIGSRYGCSFAMINVPRSRSRLSNVPVWICHLRIANAERHSMLGPSRLGRPGNGMGSERASLTEHECSQLFANCLQGKTGLDAASGTLSQFLRPGPIVEQLAER